jgi:hypothetical protein
VPAGLRLDSVQAIDIAPTLAAALGWSWDEPRDGKVIKQLTAQIRP